MFPVAQFRCFLITKSFAFTLILSTCILNSKPYLRVPMKSISRHGRDILLFCGNFAFEVVGTSSSQLLITSRFIAHVVAAALKFPKDTFSRTLSVQKWEAIKETRDTFQTPPPPPNYYSCPHELQEVRGRIWRLFLKSLIDYFDLQLLQHKNFVLCIVANL